MSCGAINRRSERRRRSEESRRRGIVSGLPQAREPGAGGEAQEADARQRGGSGCRVHFSSRPRRRARTRSDRRPIGCGGRRAPCASSVSSICLQLPCAAARSERGALIPAPQPGGEKSIEAGQARRRPAQMDRAERAIRRPAKHIRSDRRSRRPRSARADVGIAAQQRGDLRFALLRLQRACAIDEHAARLASTRPPCRASAPAARRAAQDRRAAWSRRHRDDDGSCPSRCKAHRAARRRTAARRTTARRPPRSRR